MEISKAAITAIHGLVYLANNGSETLMDVRKIADDLAIPYGYLAKILQRVSRSHLIDSVRGPHGGYRLALDPAKISLQNIIESVDGPVVVGRCELAPGSQCRRFDRCKIRRQLDKVKKQAWEAYGEITLDKFSDQFLSV
ncbi:Rrf2 family transcriptional regulator [Candidatus Poribacteria bacterium]|nr:Rrf2 family transcriptional regulator [Candidatus Poribacteria bacterium]